MPGGLLEGNAARRYCRARKCTAVSVCCWNATTRRCANLQPCAKGALKLLPVALQVLRLDALREHAQRQHFSLCHGLRFRGTVYQDARKFWNLGNPATIFLALDR